MLAFGPASRYAAFFDIDWHAPEERLRDKLVLPVLGDHYGRALESGAISLRRDRDELLVLVVHDDLVLPLSPTSLGALVARAGTDVGDASLAFAGRALIALGIEPAVATAEELWADARTAVRQASERCAAVPGVDAALDAVVAKTNRDVDALDALAEQQHYRLTRWTVALDEGGYRRFFDVSTLVALRAERPAVFDATHAKLLSLVRAGDVDGIRVDHVDGLAEPAPYCERLRAAAPASWIVVEKILAPGEQLRSSWPVDGTTGYDFAALTTPLLVDPRGEAALTAGYRAFTGDALDWTAHADAGKRLVLDEVLAADVARLADRFVRVCERRRQWRDFTRRELRAALVAVALQLPCYRTYGYVDEAGERRVDDEDRRVIRAAVDAARRSEPHLDGEVFDLLHAVLGFVASGADETDLALRFQQLTGPVRAKGEEDTALYRANRLLALNDVGHDPSVFSVDPDEFHEWCRATVVERPHTMVTTTTHDTKRSDDVRARLAVLSEVPERWNDFVTDLREHWRAERDDVGELDPAMAWFTLQTVVGAWPLTIERLRLALEKSMREAKTHTSWVHVDERYESTVRAYAAALLEDERLTARLAAFVALVEPAGRANSLVLTALRMTAAGVPDTYRGGERWDLSLVDPDNRRPVDLASNHAALRRVGASPAASWWAPGRDDGSVKLRWTHELLMARRRHGVALTTAAHERLPWRGPTPAAVVAYLRGDAMAVVAPRWFLAGGPMHTATEVEIPAGSWRDLATGAAVRSGWQTCSALTTAFPVCVLERTT